MGVKVIVVDDKPIIRRAIVSTMNWEAWGCEVVADAEDGIEGKLAIDRHQPDIIITDIRMPGMDGLSLAEYAGKVIPHCKVIVITGYEDFNYAKTCVKLGIIEFLLKPLNDEEFSSAVRRAVEQIVNHRRLQREREQLLPSAQKQLITDLLLGFHQSGETPELFQELLTRRCALLVIGGQAELERERVTKEIEALLSSHDDGNERYTIRLLNDTVIVFLFDSSIPVSVMKNRLIQRRMQLQQALLCENNGGCPLEWSGLLRNALELQDHYQRISRKLRLQFFYVCEGRSEDVIKLSILHELDQFASLLGTDTEGEMDDRIQSLLHQISNYAAGNIAVAKTLISELCLTIVKYYYKLSGNEWILSKSVNEMLEDVHHFKDMEQARKYIADMLSTLRSKQAEETPAYSPLVTNILNYIHDHYYSQEISLHKVAERFQVSPGHVSRLLRKETRSNFVDILTRTRLKAAKRLLRDPTKRIQEISEMTGFKNYMYFYQVFKKYENKSPQQYKKQT
ncbi:response regulator transcription factor [Paenibacillus sp. SAF-054]|uniref:response regulator transcription factor n=1 Tax=unclassified Paenibacillus TaxID=185978 RepID=UPI003F7E501E